MSEYAFPDGLYVSVQEMGEQSVKAEIYRRVEDNEGELLHMKRVGLIWLEEKEKTLEGLAKRLKDESSWDTHG